MAYNESHVCDVALSPTRAKGHVAERRAAAPRSPSHPEGVAMYICAVMRRCTDYSSYSPALPFYKKLLQIVARAINHAYQFDVFNVMQKNIPSMRIREMQYQSLMGKTNLFLGSIDHCTCHVPPSS
jgi:hypothetical protein